MKEMYFTIAGCNHYYGSDFMEKGMKVKLVKEPDNEYDIENLPGHKDIWKILSVANISKNKNGDSEVTINYLEFSNLTKDFKKREKTKTIVIKRKWDFYNELMDFLVEM